MCLSFISLTENLFRYNFYFYKLKKGGNFTYKKNSWTRRLFLPKNNFLESCMSLAHGEAVWACYMPRVSSVKVSNELNMEKQLSELIRNLFERCLNGEEVPLE